MALVVTPKAVYRIVEEVKIMLRKLTNTGKAEVDLVCKKAKNIDRRLVGQAKTFSP